VLTNICGIVGGKHKGLLNYLNIERMLADNFVTSRRILRKTKLIWRSYLTAISFSSHTNQRNYIFRYFEL